MLRGTCYGLRVTGLVGQTRNTKPETRNIFAIKKTNMIFKFCWE